MSFFKTLELTTGARGYPSGSEREFRAKVLAYLAEQKALAEAEIAGVPFNTTNEAAVEGVDASTEICKGWFTDASGKMFFQILYGPKLLEFSKGMNAIEVENLADLPSIIASIIDAINAGELDPQLHDARNRPEN
ncbi:MAG: hypothetical protein AB7E24_06390 [Novosphingobium sp.]